MEEKKLNYLFSDASEKKLEGVHPDLVRVIRRALELSAVDFKITEGLRTRERQKELLEAGKSQTMNSRHLTGHAIDVAVMIEGKVNWTMKYYEMVSAAVRIASDELSIPVEWGGNWKTLKDGPHFQLPFSVYPS